MKELYNYIQVVKEPSRNDDIFFILNMITHRYSNKQLCYGDISKIRYYITSFFDEQIKCKKITEYMATKLCKYIFLTFKINGRLIDEWSNILIKE